MRYVILVAPDVEKALRRLRAYDRLAVLDGIEQQLRYRPARVSRSRIKRLRDMRHPQYRLRIGEHRVFYDVAPGQVEVVAVVTKAEAAEWLARWGIRDEENSR